MKNILSTIVISLLLVNSISNAQDITNTLAPNGAFKIKDATTDYFILNQSNGTISLIEPLAGNQRGSIFKGADRFIHTYQASGTEGFNTFVGINSGNFTMSGNGGLASYNTGVGYGSLSSLTIGHSNSAFGLQSLYSNTTGSSNSAFGTGSLYSNTDGFSNSAFGLQSLYSNTTGNYNSTFGYQSLYSNTTGHSNSTFGYQSLYSNTGGISNSAFGFGSLFFNTTGYYNSAFGTGSLSNNTTGYDNTALGYFAGSGITTGSNNIAIGSDAQVPSATGSNQIRLGNTWITYAGIQVAWTVTSDLRLKDNIKNSPLGLNFISRLRPVSYYRKNDEKQKTEFGLIAQEVEEVLKSEGIDNTGMLTITDDGEYQLRYNDLIAPMIKAIQELKIQKDEQIAQLLEENKNLKSEIENLKLLKDQLTEIQSLKAELIEQINLLKTEKETSGTKFTSVSRGVK